MISNRSPRWGWLRLPALLVMALALFSGPGDAAPAPTVLFEDSFTDLGQWNAPAGWRAQNGALTVAGGGIQLCKQGQDWQHYALEFDVTIRKAMAQWVIRAEDPRNCFFIQLVSRENPYSPNSLRYHGWHKGNLDGVKEDTLPLDIEVGKSYHVRCEVVGGTVQTLIDGKIRGVNTIRRPTRGTIGFRATASEQAEYRNLKVVRCDSLTPHRGIGRPGAQSRPHDAFLNPPFRAEWIWGEGHELDRVFRTTFDVDAAALEGHLWISVDNSYRVFLNGRLLGSGDAWQTPIVHDLKPALRPGRNVLAIEAHNLEPGAAGVLAEGSVVLANGKTIELVSSKAWRTAVSPAAGWMDPGFDDSRWAPATSLGRHPQEPWAGQAEWVLPYFGAKELAEAETFKITPSLRKDAPLQIEARFRLPKAFTQAHPVRLTLVAPDGTRFTLLEQYPQQPTNTWKAGTNTLRLNTTIAKNAWPLPGKYSARLELVGVLVTSGAERLAQPVTWAMPARRQPLPLSKRPMGPGLFTDQFGGRHTYKVESDCMVYDGERLVPIAHGDGAYWCIEDPARREAVDAYRDTAVLERVRRYGLTEEPVRVRLLDTIECADPKSEAAHDFSEDDGFGGRSRLMKIGDRTYRVTDSRPRLSYFAYTMRCKKAGAPHLMMFETPNDRERYTLVRIQPPWRNVGAGPFTGRALPVDGKPIHAGFVFYPEHEQIRLTVSRMPSELNATAESGGAVSRLWLFEIADDLQARRAEVSPTTGKERRIGLSVTHPAYLYDLYGYRYGPLARRLASLNAFADYADFVGLNHLEYNAINGADTSEAAYHPTKIWKQHRGESDLFREFLPIAEHRGFTVIPCFTSMAFDGSQFTDAPWISPLTFQIDKDGFRRRDFFKGRGNDHTLPDPLRPEAQKVFLDTLREFAEQCKHSPAVQGLAFRLNGKIGTCYVGYNEDEDAATAGYSPWNLAEFQKDTGIKLPGWDPTLEQRWLDAWKAGRKDDPAMQYITRTYEWLRANKWQEWIDWRCQRTATFWRQARDLTRSYRPDWNLVVKCDMPSETPGRNIHWPAGRPALELFREHGFDPRLYAKEPGILLQQGYFLGGGEYFCHLKGSHKARNPWAWSDFDRQPGLAELYRTPAGASTEFYNNYWEETGVARMGEFGTDFWGAGMMYPYGRYFFRQILHALRSNNPHTMVLFSWERGSEGHEGELRRFCRAFRALPVAPAEAFEGKVTVQSGPAADDTLWVRRIGNRVALVNENAQPRVLRVTLPASKAGQGIYEYASQRRLADAGKPVTVTVEMDAFDLRVLGAE